MGQKFRGWGEGQWDGEWLEMKEKECSSDGGPRLARGPPKTGLAASI